VPKHRLPDGVELHWEERGEGPLVVVCPPCISVPGAYDGVVGELVSDHRVVTYDTRGTGESTRTGPYDIDTDAADLIGLLEQVGGDAVLIGFGDGMHRSVVAGGRRPDLIRAAVSPGVTALGPQREYDSSGGGLASSPAVIGALIQLLETDYRSGLRTVVEGGNPQFSDDEVQERIDAVLAYSPHEATLSRMRSWVRKDSREGARAMGDRLWILTFPGNAWFPEDLVPGIQRDLPEARVEAIENGAVSRPDLTAEVVRRITGC
jgi:pimeloyl-ACP methyl ester carboxylesterase